MANPNIDLLGAVYPAVAGVTLPKQGGGTATFPWVEGSQTVTQNNTYDVTNLAQMVVNVTGGGGASNVVTGTFKGTTAGAALEITLPYTGTGYPIGFVICPKEGPFNASTGTFYDLVQRYSASAFFAIKNKIDSFSSYEYSAGRDTFTRIVVYKSSATNASSYSTASSIGSSTAYIYYQSEAAVSTNRNIVRMKSATKMSVFIASDSHGFAANIEYTYYVIYSS